MTRREGVSRGALVRLALTVSIMCAAALPAGASAATVTLPRSTWVTNASGQVRSIASVGNNIYIGGGFDYLGPDTGTSVALSAGDGSIALPPLKGSAVVHAIVPDGTGGFYIGGDAYLVHQLANGSLDSSFKPKVNGAVDALALAGGRLYVGGDFTTINASTRHSVGALNTATGTVAAWNPLASGTNLRVNAIAVAGSTVYVGGAFSKIGGQPRVDLAALSASTAKATSWDPGIPSDSGLRPVTVLTLGGSTLYVAGGFSTIGGQSRDGLAAVDTLTSTVTGWDPAFEGVLFALAVEGSTVYLGGSFTVDGQASHLAAVDAATGQQVRWAATTDDDVRALALSGDGSTLYAGGFFTTFNGQPAGHIAAVDPATGDLDPWGATTSDAVRALAVSGSTIEAGGEFTSADGVPRNGLAAIDPTTGAATSWNPNPDGQVLALAASGSTIYVSGFFTEIGGQPRAGLAALDALTGTASPWNPGVPGSAPPGSEYVSALVVSSDGSTVYAGGRFNEIAGQSRHNLAALDATTGAATSWNPGTSSGGRPDAAADVDALALSGSTLYVGGQYGEIAGQPSSGLAGVDTTTGALTGFNPALKPVNTITAGVYALTLSGSTLYAGGQFTQVGATRRDGLVAFNTATGAETSWNPAPAPPLTAQMEPPVWIHSLAVSGSTVYAGGTFTKMGGQARTGLAGLSETSNMATSFNPLLNGDALALLPVGSTLWVGGRFTTAAGASQAGLAAYQLS
jgi:hypothetical protein